MHGKPQQLICAHAGTGHAAPWWATGQQMWQPLCLSKEPLSPWSPETFVLRYSQNELFSSNLFQKPRLERCQHINCNLTRDLVYRVDLILIFTLTSTGISRAFFSFLLWWRAVSHQGGPSHHLRLSADVAGSPGPTTLMASGTLSLKGRL